MDRPTLRPSSSSGGYLITSVSFYGITQELYVVSVTIDHIESVIDRPNRTGIGVVDLSNRMHRRMIGWSV
jgi:hypothetical protein